MTDTLLSTGDDGAQAAASAYMAKQLWHFQRGHSWDAQWVGGSYHPEFVDYATVAIGLYASAAGLSKDDILCAEDLVARTSRFAPNRPTDPDYTHLPRRNVRNTDRGYQLYQAGRIAPPSTR